MSIKDTRAMALAMQKRASSKVSRNKSKGIEIGGTRFDPRRKNDFIKGATTKQLNQYMDELGHFLDRGQQFVGDREGSPVHVSQWRYYKRVEKQRNAKVLVDNELVAGVFITESGLTAGERHALMDASRTQAGTPSVYHDWKPILREPWNINGGSKNLSKLTDTLKNTTKSDYNNKEAIIGRQSIDKMAAQLNAPDLKKAVDKLSQQQFWFLWKNTKFAGDIALPYLLAIKQGKKATAAQNDTIESHTRKAIRQANWANKLDVNVNIPKV